MEAIATRRSERKAKGQGGERRAEILAHALRLFSQRGVHEVSTRHIAEAVGISQPTLYAYFRSKDELLSEVCAEAFQTLADRMRRALQAVPEDQQLEAIGREYIRFGLEQPDAYRIAFMIEGAHGAKGGDDLPLGLGPGLVAFSVLLECVRRRLGADHPDVDLAAQSLWAAEHGLVSLLIARAEFPWVEHDRLIAHHLTALLKGLPPRVQAPEA